MANTFDTSRVGGGTYELAQDANGNYNLNSVGFTQVNKLNLPDLKTSDTTSVADTTKKATEDTIKAQTTEVFKPANTYNNGGGQGSQLNTSTLKDAKVNEATVRQAGSTPASEFATQQAKANQAAPQENIGTTPTYQDGILRGQTGVKYSKPPSLTSKATSAVQDTVSGVIDSVKNSKAIGYAATALGFITGAKPVMGAFNMLSKVVPKDSPTDKFNRGYFNMDAAESGGRISGNPATNVFAGMNAVSAFGNISTGAQNRVDNRAKTAAKNKGKWSQDKMDKFNSTTATFEKQINNHERDKGKSAEKAAVTKGLDIQNPNEMKNAGGGGGSSSGRVICTELHRTGELSTQDWVRDTKFTFKTLSKTHVKGYLLWAEPTVKHINKYPKYRKMWKHIAQHRANDIAWRLNEGKFDLLGRIYAGIGEPLCWALGNFVSDKQISKYNLTHWRRA